MAEELAISMKNVSIALCTYNGEKYLSEQLESFKVQTVLPDEVVVCDDGSTDKTHSIIREFSQTAPFEVRLFINEKNLGVTKNFEKAISQCEGDLIFLSDQDDVWREDKIALICEEFDKSPNVGLIFTNATLTDENLLPLGDELWDFSFTEWKTFSKEDDFFQLILRKNIVTGATMAFRKKLEKLFSPMPPSFPNLIHDNWIALCIAYESELGFINKPLIKYRQHRDQQLGINWKYQMKINQISRFENYERSIKREKQTLIDYKKVNQNQITELFSKSFTKEKIFNEILEQNAEETRKRILHYEARQKLPSSRLRRFLPIIRELKTGRYHHFSKGFRSAMKDFLDKF